MKLKTEQLLGTLEVLNEPLQGFNETLSYIYDTFCWDALAKGSFNIWNLMNYKKFIQPMIPEDVIYNWLTEEQTHAVAIDEHSSLERPDNQTLLNDVLKAERAEKYQSLLQLLKLELQNLEGFSVKLCEYDKSQFCCGLIGKNADNNWIAILPTCPQRLSLPHWITHSPFVETNVQPTEKNTLKLQVNIENILQELLPLNLIIPYCNGKSYTYNYQLFQTASFSKEAAFNQIMLNAKMLEMRKFEYFLSAKYEYNYLDDSKRKNEQNVNKFFKENFPDAIVYRFGLYDIDYAYVVSQVADTDWLGVIIYSFYCNADYNS